MRQQLYQHASLVKTEQNGTAHELLAWNVQQKNAVGKLFSGLLLEWETEWFKTPTLAEARVLDGFDHSIQALAPCAETGLHARESQSIVWTIATDSPPASCRDEVATDPLAVLSAKSGLSKRLFGSTSWITGSVSEELVSVAWKHWWIQLAALLGEMPSETECKFSRVSANPPEIRPWSGKLLVRIAWCSTNLDIFLTANLVRKILAHAAPELLHHNRQPVVAPPLTKLSEAIRGRSVTLRAELRGTDLTLGQIQALTLGDVIVLDHKLSEPVSIAAPSGRRTASGWLGQKEGRRALELSRNNAQQ